MKPTCSAHKSFLDWDQSGFPDVDLPVRITGSTDASGSPRADLRYEDGSMLILVLGKFGLNVFWSEPA
jgi:hypothetical protein